MKNRLTELEKQDSKHLYNREKTEFSKIRVGIKTLEDANLTLNNFAKINPRLGDKKTIQNAIWKGDLDTLKDISLFFSRTSGIYNRLINHLANFYRYDWLITPYKNSNAVKDEAVIDGFTKVLNYFDNSSIKQFFTDSAH